MYDFDIDGRLQVTAGVGLLECSRLVQWCPGKAKFSPVSRKTFESSWRRDVDPAFGRLICWINFSAGAEMLAKGVCLLHTVELRSTQTVPAYPSGDLALWSTAYLKHWKSGGTIPSIDYGTLGHLVDQTNRKTKLPPALPRLFDKVNVIQADREIILAAYGILARTIRNRDAHAYIPNVRDRHFSLVSRLFARCFNILVSWLPGGSGILNIWKQEARKFNAALLISINQRRA
jgi:hypothetical protein